MNVKQSLTVELKVKQSITVINCVEDERLVVVSKLTDWNDGRMGMVKG